MRALAIIPARLSSRRLPRKILLRESGKYLVQHVYERVADLPGLARVVVATDSAEVREACASFGAEALMTSPEHSSGTDRVAEAARQLEARGERFEVVVNVQGDEPELEPSKVSALLELMEGGDPMGTLAEPLSSYEDFALPQVVKVVLDAAGRALLFSRAPIPAAARLPEGAPLEALRHVGIYAFRSDFLQLFPRLPVCQLELREGLEQLRALYHGHAIRVGVVTPSQGRGIDTRSDYDAFLSRCRSGAPDQAGDRDIP
jgi:3-deoxy-manno-octulosonate cytidylyltransferase (CMP-KDO synthetase)